MLGWSVGDTVGFFEGLADGDTVGFFEGLDDGLFDGDVCYMCEE